MRQLCRFAFTLALLASYSSLAAAQTESSGSTADAAAKKSPQASDDAPDAAKNRADQEGAEKLNMGSSQNRDKEPAEPTAIEVKPEIHYLRDRDGQLVPVPGIAYEEFIELVRQRDQLKQRREVPRYALRELIASGQAKGDHAAIQVQIGLRLNEGGWTAIPLGLSECTLSGEIKYRGDGDYFFHFDSASNQYVAWLKGELRSEHELTFGVVAPVSGGGGSTALQFSLPKAASSKLVLDVPGNVTAKSTAPHAVVEAAAIDDSTTRISAIGVAGNVSIAWSERDRAAEALPLLLETTGVVLVTIDGRSVRSEINLTVRSFGREFQEFRVRLPKGSILTGNQQAVGYTLTSVGAEAAPMVQVKLDEKTAGPVDVKFAVERTYDVTRPNEVLELAGFDVVEAPSHRQGGQIGVIVSGDWQVKWENPRVRVRQIDEPLPQLDRRGLLAVFEYVGRQCSLPARVAARQTRVSVEPEYVYYIDGYESRLEGRLKYAIRGAKVFSLELDLPGWTVDEVGPPTIVDTKTLAPGEDARLIVPLLEPTTGDVEITVKARRAHSRNPDDIQINLPTLVADSPKPATVVILPADNVELATRSDQLAGLSPQGVPPGLQLPYRRQPPLVFRAERSPSRYVAGLSVQPQKISVRIGTSARLEPDHIDVEQQFSYQVLYEPVDRLHFVGPGSFGPPKNWQVAIGDRRLTPIVVAAGHDLSESTQYQIPLGAPRLGQVELISRYSIPLHPAKPTNGHNLNLPLPMPLEGELISNILTLEMDGGLRADLRPGSWTLIDPKKAIDESRRLFLSSPTAANTVALSISLEEHRPVAGSIVERGWIQTWLLDGTRQERAVFRIRSRDSAVTINLPPDVSTSDMEAMLDGRPVKPTLNGQRRLSVAWPADDGAHVLELRYRFLNVESSWMSSANTAPQFDDNVHVRRTYWQVVVPGDRHLLTAHSATPEFQWRWDGLAFKRLNLIDQAELEHWATGGAATVEAPIPESANVYLFSATRPETLELWIGRRSIIVFVASAILLSAALLLLRFAALRQPWTLAALGFALIIFALAFPDLAILLGQASVIGLLLAGLGVVLRGALHRHVTSDETVHSGSSLVRDRGVTELYYQPAPAAPPVSTASGALAAERSATESHAG